MIEKMHATLHALEGQLQTLWIRYLGSKPSDWLLDRRTAQNQLAEMEAVGRNTQAIQDKINTIHQYLDSPAFDPIREKEE